MALSVIGAGMGRTGTNSLRLALNQLGMGPCHHMFEVMANPEQVPIWRAAGRGELPDWDNAYAGYRSAVDWPTAYFWRELATHYPEAKVILTVRDPDDWFESVSKTIGPKMDPATNDPASFGVAVIGQKVFGGRVTERDHAISAFERHNENVRSALPADRLLVYRTGDGWEPLCAFLGIPVPTEPYPRSNDTASFLARGDDDAGTPSEP